MNLFDLKKHSTNIALIDGDSKHILSYTDLNNATQNFIKSFDTKKALCFIFIDSTIENIIAYLSLINSGLAVALFETGIPFKQKEKLINLYKPRYVIENANNTSSCINTTRYTPLVTSLASLKVWEHKFPDQQFPINTELQLLLSTSGTTGNPKLIRLSKTNVLANANSICEYLDISSKDRAIASLPFHYSYGLSVLHTHLLQGASITLTSRSIIQEQFWEIVNYFCCTSLAGVPYTYQIIDRLGLEKLNCPSLKTLTQAGGKLSSALINKFYSLMAERQGRFFTMYGQTEATARIAYLPPSYLPTKSGAIGIAIPKGILQLFKEGIEITQPFNEGEIVYSGPNVMLGYATTSEDLALGDTLHGILRTGDIGHFDEDGIYYVTGRLKRFSKIYGHRINLDDIEQALNQFGPIAVTGNDNKITLHSEHKNQIDMEQCIIFLASTYHLPISIFAKHVMEQFPLTASGKIDYTKLDSSQN